MLVFWNTIQHQNVITILLSDSASSGGGERYHSIGANLQDKKNHCFVHTSDLYDNNNNYKRIVCWYYRTSLFFKQTEKRFFVRHSSETSDKKPKGEPKYIARCGWIHVVFIISLPLLTYWLTYIICNSVQYYWPQSFVGKWN